MNKSDTTRLYIIYLQGLVFRGQLKGDGTGAENNFVFRRNGPVHLNRRGGVSSVDYWLPSCAHQR